MNNDLEVLLIAQNFLAREAKALDERRFDDWLEMLDEDILYHVPLREARLEYADEFSDGAYRIRDDFGLLKVRVDRLKSGQAWAEVPPSRTLRVVGSVFAEKTSDNVITAESALLVYRQRGHEAPGELIPVRRTDKLRLHPDGPRLLERTAVITEVSLTTPNLGVFI